MPMYRISKTREGLSSPEARSPWVSHIADVMTDLPSPQYEGPDGSLDGVEPVGVPYVGLFTVYPPGSSSGKRMQLRYWLLREDGPLSLAVDTVREMSYIDDQKLAQTAVRDDAIRAALEQGEAPAEISRATGLSVARIYQIRDGRR